MRRLHEDAGGVEERLIASSYNFDDINWAIAAAKRRKSLKPVPPSAVSVGDRRSVVICRCRARSRGIFFGNGAGAEHEGLECHHQRLSGWLPAGVRALNALGTVDRSSYHNLLIMAVEDPLLLLEAIERETDNNPALYDAISRVAPAM